MNEYKLSYSSKVPLELAETFKVNSPSETKTLFSINRDMIVQEFENGISFCAVRDDEYLHFYANVPFDQTIPVNSRKVTITFDSEEN